MASLTEQWDAIVARQPDDWSSLYLQLDLRDAAQSEETALALSPLNPWHETTGAAASSASGGSNLRLRIRSGACRKRLGTLDAVGVIGTLKLTRLVSDIKPAHTQGVV